MKNLNEDVLRRITTDDNDYIKNKLLEISINLLGEIEYYLNLSSIDDDYISLRFDVDDNYTITHTPFFKIEEEDLKSIIEYHTKNKNRLLKKHHIETNKNKEVENNGIKFSRDIIALKDIKLSSKLILNVICYFNSLYNSKISIDFILNVRTLNSLATSTIEMNLKKLKKLNYIRFEKIHDTTYVVANNSYNFNSYMFIPYSILECNNLTLSQKLLLCYINSFNQSNSNCRANNKAICEFFNISIITLKRSLALFNKLDLLDTSYNKTRGFIKTNRNIKLKEANINNINDVDLINRIKEVEKVEKVEKVENVEVISEIKEVKEVEVVNEVKEINEINEINEIKEINEVNVNNINNTELVDRAKEINVNNINNVELINEIKKVEKIETEHITLNIIIPNDLSTEEHENLINKFIDKIDALNSNSN